MKNSIVIINVISKNIENETLLNRIATMIITNVTLAKHRLDTNRTKYIFQREEYLY